MSSSRRRTGAAASKNVARYSLEELRRHTRDIRLTNAELLRQQGRIFDAAIHDFEQLLNELERSNDVLSNVQKILATKFFNHWYSTLLLCEAGLMVDALACERNALETLAYHWLVLLEPSVADNYEKSAILKPVEVRKRLEKLGADISHLRASYQYNSGVAHVGRDSERFHVQWRATRNGQLLFGGRFSKIDSEHWFSYLPVLLRIFKKPLMRSADQIAVDP